MHGASTSPPPPRTPFLKSDQLSLNLIGVMPLTPPPPHPNPLTSPFSYVCVVCLSVLRFQLQFNYWFKLSRIVDGSWSDWGAWYPCSVTCGGGIQIRFRTCTNPPPSHGGRYCVGPNSDIRTCGTQRCPCKYWLVNAGYWTNLRSRWRDIGFRWFILPSWQNKLD